MIIIKNLKNVLNLNDLKLKPDNSFLTKRKNLNFEEFENLKNLKEKIYNSNFSNKNLENYSKFYDFMENCYKPKFSKKNNFYRKINSDFEKSIKKKNNEYEICNTKILAINLLHQECSNKFLDLVKIQNSDLYSSLGLINEIFNNSLNLYISKMDSLKNLYKKILKENFKLKDFGHVNNKNDFEYEKFFNKENDFEKNNKNFILEKNKENENDEIFEELLEENDKIKKNIFDIKNKNEKILKENKKLIEEKNNFEKENLKIKEENEKIKKEAFDRTASLIKRLEKVMIENSILSNNLIIPKKQNYSKQKNILSSKIIKNLNFPILEKKKKNLSLRNSKKSKSMENSLVEKKIEFENWDTFSKQEKKYTKKNLVLSEILELVEKLLNEKIKYNLQCDKFKFRYETIKKFVKLYFNNKYSKKEEVEEWIYYLEMGIKKFKKKEIKILLFFFLYNNRIDENYFLIQKELRITCKKLFKIILKKNYSVTKSNLVNDEWQKKISNQEILEKFEVCELINKLCGSAKNDVLKMYFKKNPKFFFYSSLEFKILEFYLIKHSQFLEKTKNLFFNQDKNYFGFINTKQFFEIFQNFSDFCNFENLVELADPFNHDFITFSRFCFSLLNNKVDFNGEVINVVQLINYLE